MYESTGQSLGLVTMICILCFGQFGILHAILAALGCLAGVGLYIAFYFFVVEPIQRKNLREANKRFEEKEKKRWDEIQKSVAEENAKHPNDPPFYPYGVINPTIWKTKNEL